MAFNRTGRGNDSRGGGPRSFGGDRGGPRSFGGRDGGRDGGAPKSFDVTCARCGVATTVPFKPTGEKPVLCRNCFNNPDGAPARSAGPRAGNERGPGGNSGMSNELLMEINQKLDRIMEALDIDQDE